MREKRKYFRICMKDPDSKVHMNIYYDLHRYAVNHDETMLYVRERKDLSHFTTGDFSEQLDKTLEIMIPVEKIYNVRVKELTERHAATIGAIWENYAEAIPNDRRKSPRLHEMREWPPEGTSDKDE
jgi:hypothetical protein